MGFLKKVQFYIKFHRKRHLPSKPSQFTDAFRYNMNHQPPCKNNKWIIKFKSKTQIKPVYHSHQQSGIQKVQKWNSLAEYIQHTVSRSFILMKLQRGLGKKEQEREPKRETTRGLCDIGNSFDMLMLLWWPAIILFGTPKRQVTAHKISLQTMKLCLFHHPWFNSNGNSRWFMFVFDGFSNQRSGK